MQSKQSSLDANEAVRACDLPYLQSSRIVSFPHILLFWTRLSTRREPKSLGNLKQPKSNTYYIWASAAFETNLPSLSH
jgi:hypothetical protein